MSKEDSRNELSEFFGEHGGSRLFTKLFIEPTNFTTSINAEATPDSIATTNQTAYDMMLNESYDDYTKPKGSSNNDLHYQFTDFIIELALFHREIDKPTGIGQLVADFLKKIPEVLNAIMTDTDTNMDDNSGYILNDLEKTKKIVDTHIGTKLEELDKKYRNINTRTIAEYSILLRENNIQDKNIFIDSFRKIIDQYPPPYTKIDPTRSLFKNIVEKIWNKWDDLTPNATQFYKKHLRFFKDNVQVSDNQIGKGPIDDTYRLNLVKTAIGSVCPRFYYLIPFLPTTITGIWYTDKNGTQQRIIPGNFNLTENYDTKGTSAPDDNFILKQLYCGVYQGKDRVGNFINLPTKWTQQNTAKIFNINVDKLVRKLLFAKQKLMANAGKNLPKGPLVGMADKGIWYRDNTGRLYRDINNTRAYYGDNDPETEKMLRKDFKCYSTLLKGKPEDCEKYMIQCLLNGDANDVQACIDNWKQKDFYQVARDEIRNMHPQVALATLKKFGFGQREEHDEIAGVSLIKIESRDHWVKNQLEPLWKKKTDSSGTDTVADIINKNTELLDYLDLVVQYVNANPAILNKNYSGKTNESVGVPVSSQLAMQLGIKMQKLPSNLAQYDAGRLSNSLVSSYYAQTRNRAYGTTYSSPFSPNNLYLGPGTPIALQLGQSGGYHHEKQTSGPSALKAMIEGVISDLKQLGKEIVQEDKDIIYQKLDELRKVEKELLETSMYLEEFKIAHDVFTGYRSEILSLDNIQNFVNKQRRLDSRKINGEKDLVHTLNTLVQNLSTNDKNTNTNDNYNEINY
jgi:hypothetical protein